MNREQLSSLKEQLGAAYRDRRTIVIEGGGTKRDWGAMAPPAAVTLSTRGLDAVVEHRFGDLTATVQAGAALADVNRTLVRHGQWIALDPPASERATIGGILATNDSGPRRHRFGAPRDNIIGIEVICVDGTTARAGGIVVKNVAGYDLGRLMTGSFGSLALIASATFKLYPIAPASRTVVVDLHGAGANAAAERAGAAVAALTSTQLTPTAIELQTHPARLLVRFESIEPAADEQAAAAAGVVSAHGDVAIVADADEASLWQAHGARPWDKPGAVLKVTCLPDDLASILGWLEQTLHGADWDVIGRAGVGVLLVRLDAEPVHQARAINGLRARVPSGRGSVVVVRASDELKRAVDVWGPAGDALPLMRAIKRQFDPHGLLNPGRGPFGI